LWLASSIDELHILPLTFSSIDVCSLIEGMCLLLIYYKFNHSGPLFNHSLCLLQCNNFIGEREWRSSFNKAELVVGTAPRYQRMHLSYPRSSPTLKSWGGFICFVIQSLLLLVFTFAL
jgi:hypothetical protein